jgi:hypothetical protein
MNRQPPPCGHSACRQNYIDNGDDACVVVSDAVANFVNGNRSDVKAALAALPPLEAARVAVRVYWRLDKADQVHFLSWIEAIA